MAWPRPPPWRKKSRHRCTNVPLARENETLYLRRVPSLHLEEKLTTEERLAALERRLAAVTAERDAYKVSGRRTCQKEACAPKVGV